MIENLIVIPTNNGGKTMISTLLSSIERCGVDYKILIVDTISNDEDHLQFLKDLAVQNPDITITQTPRRTFDTGAYVWAYQNYEANHYHFIHDSMFVKDSNFFNQIFELFLKGYDVIPYLWFREFGMDFWKTRDVWTKIFLDNNCFNEIDYGIFGPMFSCKRNVLEKLNITEFTLPTTKAEQNAFERIWAILFEREKLSVYKWFEFERNFMISDGYPHIGKTFHERL
jgi:hypothetical protein